MTPTEPDWIMDLLCLARDYVDTVAVFCGSHYDVEGSKWDLVVAPVWFHTEDEEELVFDADIQIRVQELIEKIGDVIEHHYVLGEGISLIGEREGTPYTLRLFYEPLPNSHVLGVVSEDGEIELYPEPVPSEISDGEDEPPVLH